MSRDDPCVPRASADLSSWADPELLGAVCDTAGNSAALDTLVRRHARALERRCRIITGDRDHAADLAQETWSRMLRTRATVSADGSFRAYLAKIALNLWRDERKALRHARELSEQRLLSRNADIGDDDTLTIWDMMAGPSLTDESLLLRLDLGSALARLPARLRAVVVARHVRGESAADIGRRYGRTEQTITTWLREATARMQLDLRDWRYAA